MYCYDDVVLPLRWCGSVNWASGCMCRLHSAATCSTKAMFSQGNVPCNSALSPRHSTEGEVRSLRDRNSGLGLMMVTIIEGCSEWEQVYSQMFACSFMSSYLYRPLHSTTRYYEVTCER